MKSSNYNYIFYKDEYVYFYNGLTHAYFRCSSSLGKKLCLDLLLSYFPHSFHLDGRFLTKEPNIHKGDWVICPITKNKNKINDAGKTGDFDAEG